MSRQIVDLSPEEEVLILLFWAYSKDVEAKLGPDKLRTIPGLGEAIKALATVLDAIGWGDESLTQRQKGWPPNREKRPLQG